MFSNFEVRGRIDVEEGVAIRPAAFRKIGPGRFEPVFDVAHAARAVREGVLNLLAATRGPESKDAVRPRSATRDRIVRN